MKVKFDAFSHWRRKGDWSCTLIPTLEIERLKGAGIDMYINYVTIRTYFLFWSLNVYIHSNKPIKEN